MGERNPKHLAVFSFVICAVASGFGFGLNGGNLSGWGDWLQFLGFVVVASLLVALVVYGFGRMIAEKTPNYRKESK